MYDFPGEVTEGHVLDGINQALHLETTKVMFILGDKIPGGKTQPTHPQPQPHLLPEYHHHHHPPPPP